jgi:hypothetical protein
MPRSQEHRYMLAIVGTGQSAKCQDHKSVTTYMLSIGRISQSAKCQDHKSIATYMLAPGRISQSAKSQDHKSAYSLAKCGCSQCLIST